MARRIALFVAVLLGFCANAHADCSPLGKSRSDLDQLKASGWAIDSESERAAFAIALSDCLSDPDPAVRDGIAFEALQFYLRKGLLSEKTQLQLLSRLLPRMQALDPQGFGKPFVALILAEIVRSDRIKPFLPTAQRGVLVDAAVSYIISITDYRAFDPKEGYRHAVAHAADFVMQLAMNPAIDTKALSQLRHAISTQVGPVSTSYVTGEGERLARAVLMMAKRKVFDQADWTNWFKVVVGPGSLKSWDGWHLSSAAIARKHNLTQFVSAVYVSATASSDGDFIVLRSASLEALKALP